MTDEQIRAAAAQWHDNETGGECPRCGSTIRFTILAGGQSRGQCVAAKCIRWAQ